MYNFVCRGIGLKILIYENECLFCSLLNVLFIAFRIWKLMSNLITRIFYEVDVISFSIKIFSSFLWCKFTNHQWFLIYLDFYILKALIALKKGSQLIKYSRKGKPKLCPFRISSVSLYAIFWFSCLCSFVLFLFSLFLTNRSFEFFMLWQPIHELNMMSIWYFAMIDVQSNLQAWMDNFIIGFKN